jgi:hypothetical protein
VRLAVRGSENNDPTFNQELGINDAGVIGGYFGSGAAGHPNKGYTVVQPFKTQSDFTNENFPGSIQTQVTGIHNRGRFDFDRAFRDEDHKHGTTVGFWSDMNDRNIAVGSCIEIPVKIWASESWISPAS